MFETNLNLAEGMFSQHASKKSTRDGFGEGLVILGEQYPNVYVLTADLAESTRASKFAAKYPKRFIEMGIAEQNMATVAAGLALEGKLPVMCSMAAFSPSRNFDQIKSSLVAQGLSVIIGSSHTGLHAAADGISQQAIEDIALMRSLPGVTILSPIDYVQTIQCITKAPEIPGVVYIRYGRENTHEITTMNTPFDLSVPLTLLEGSDLTVVTTGLSTHDAIAAARNLSAKHKMRIELIAMHMIKPITLQAQETILKSAQKTGKVITVEEHNIFGGLGSAVAEILGEHHPTLLKRIGINDTFAQSGNYLDLKRKQGLDSSSLEKTLMEFSKKGSR